MDGADTCSPRAFAPVHLITTTLAFNRPLSFHLTSASSCDLGGEPHDALLWLAGHDHATLNTEKQYPYVSGETGKLTKCSPKLDGVATGVHMLLFIKGFSPFAF